MKFIKFFCSFVLFVPAFAFGANNSEFDQASKLLTAARRGDIRTVQFLINSGANVNYVDATGLSLVCTAVMNNDVRAIQVLQMYGADASNCDRQIKQYRNKTNVARNGEQYGFFSGLSSTQKIALIGVGGVLVVGGVVLLTDIFDKKENNNVATGSHSGGGGGGGGGGGDSASKLFTVNIPYGPACSGSSCPSDFSLWETSPNFTYMSDDSDKDTFNYLMVARVYNAFVRGYLGMDTIRIASTKEPFNLSSLPYTSVPGGGKPFNVAMITASGVNLGGSMTDAIIPWVDSTQISTIQSACAGDTSSDACQEALSAAIKLSHKLFNYTGNSATTGEDASFDLSGSGTVFGSATDSDTKLAKIIAGWANGGLESGDYYGVMPNGQLTVYKTGDGNWYEPTAGMETSGSYTMAGTSFVQDDTITLTDDTELTLTSVTGNTFVAKDENGNKYAGYVDGNNLYVGTAISGVYNQTYEMGNDSSLTLTEYKADYKSYEAIYKALSLTNLGDYVTNAVANLSLQGSASNLGYATVDTAKSLVALATTPNEKKTVFGNLIDAYYNLNKTDDSTAYGLPSANAAGAFQLLANKQKYILVNPAGRSKYGLGEGEILDAQIATFENFAPAVYNEMKDYFMTVVAVRPEGGTSSFSTVDSYSPTGDHKLELSTWTDENSNTYASRICGLAGTGNDGAINPWCFAAPGATDLDATAAMAGSVALVSSAFDYMTPDQVFLLLALTADGPFLGTNPSTNKAWASTTDLVSYLKEIYNLPISEGADNVQYLENFKQSFGYGMINLERATMPGGNLYFYSSDKQTIVSASGNAYWRLATSTTTSSSSALNLTGRASITTSFYDIIESADGSISLPRVWTTEFAMDSNNNKHNLYLGDVLGDFNVDTKSKQTNNIGKFSFDMKFSQRAYSNEFGGLDNLRVAFIGQDVDVVGEYQHYLTDGESRFNGRSNGLLALVSDAIDYSMDYKLGGFNFGARVFSGSVTDENLLESDPVISSQFEPGRLGLAAGGAFDIGYKSESFSLKASVGNMQETNTVLGMYSDGLFGLSGGKTNYIDVVAVYNPIENVKLSLRGTFANTTANPEGVLISYLSDIKSNAFSFGADVGGFSFTAALPLATIDGKMGYDYAEYQVVENDGKYEVMTVNPHIEYIDLKSQKRELRFSSYYKRALGEFTDAGVGFIYRVNPNNTDAFGNESILMFKMHHRLGI